MLRFLVLAPAALGWLALVLPPEEERALPPVDFQRDVRPILSDNCFACHGPDEEARQADLRLDLKEEAFADLGGYFAVKPGELKESELWYRIVTDAEFDVMPPKDSGLSLTAEEIDTLRRWIEEGAEWSQHWAFVAPERVPAPAVEDEGWPRDDMDRFVLARLEAEGMKPSPEASRATLLRRLSLDLTGLPPTPEELDAFAGDDSPDAYGKQVDRLLASPRFGERMALPWLDAARYADTNGYHRDAARTMWLWRDWLIDSLNANKPYDDFVVEQLAGDLLPEPTSDQLVATGFNRNHMLNDEGGAIPEEYQVEYVVDRVRTTATVFLGLTMACGQCHDHKYDPIRQEDYYRFYAFFNKLPEKGLDGSDGPAEPKLVVPREEDEREIEELSAEIEEIRGRMSAPLPEVDAAEARWAAEAAKALDARWETLVPTVARATGDAVLEVLEDGSVFASGKNPQTADYELEARVDAYPVTGLWLEVLRDESFAHGSAARTSHGNFVVSELHVEAVSVEDPSQSATVAFASAWADYSQTGYAIANAVDGDPKTGWAVDGHVLFENRNAYFVPEEPFGFPGGTLLRVRMEQNYGYQHTLGRFRLSAASGEPLAPSFADKVVAGPWSLLGPIGGDPDRLFRLHDPAQVGVDAEWVEQPDFHDGESHALSGERSAFYLRRTMTSPSARTHTLSLGSDDSIVLWVNGVRVLANNAKRGVAPDQERVDVQLREGPNEILLKVVNYGGPAGFYFRVAAEGPPVLPGDVTVALRDAAADRPALRDHYRRNFHPGWSEWTGRIDELQATIDDVRESSPALMVMRDEPGVRPTMILERGQYDRAVREVTAGTPAFLPPLSPRGDGEPDRLDLARWMVDPGHPLTARIAVNRVWQTLFGVGLVTTPEDFGAQGDWPSHPGLLDRLARDFVDDGWDLKGLVRRIVTSATYRQSSDVHPDAYERDPRNRLLGRAPKYRIQAELVRDAALFAAGLLVEELGGPSVRPYQPEGLWAEVSFNNKGRSESDFYTPDSGDGLYRRSMYTFWKRSLPPPNLQTFDAPNREVCTVRRDPTNTPLQALVLLNDPTFVEAARALAQRTLLADGDLANAFRRVTSRAPEDEELVLLSEYLAVELERFRGDPESASALLAVGESMPDERLDPAELAAWTEVCSLLLNLDEAITRR